MLISGGVDSSVALKLLKDHGYKVTAFYIKIWMEDKFSHLGKCPWEEDLTYVEKVCDELNVPLEIVPLQKEYWQRVVKEAIEEVRLGRTPNPDIWCNQRVKFGAFYDYIGDKFDKVATGHYAQVIKKNNKFYLKRAPDLIKDQTYFLVYLNQQQLSRAMFPIGHLTKNEVRKLAHKFNLPTKDRKDSQGICFLGKIKYRDFIKEHLGIKKGDIINYQTNKKVGEHDGFWYYTIGQRKDIKLSGGPWYVVKKDIVKNIIYIADSKENINQARSKFIVNNLHWIVSKPQTNKLQVKIRHGAKIYNCQIKFLDKVSLEVILIDEKDEGIAAGQSAVFYDNDICLGGGVIE